MLPLDTIVLEYPTYLHEKKAHILKEFLQYKILSIVYTSKYAQKLCFLGGTALRIVHQNTRFSEDLDFDNLGITEEQWTDLSVIIQKNLILEGLEVEIRNIFKGAYHCHVKIPNLLYKENISSLPAQKILIQLDTVPQNFVYTPQKHIISRADVSTTIFSTPKDLLLSQKIFAAFGRKRPKGRDFFDIVFLMAIGAQPNIEYLRKNTEVLHIEQIKEYILDKSKNLDFKKLAKDVQPFLFYPNDAQKIIQFREFISLHLP